MLHGLGRKTGLSQPTAIAPCHSAMMEKKARTGAIRRGCGAKPPPRNATIRLPSSRIEDLAVGDHRLLPDRLPELLTEPGERALRGRVAALAPRDGDPPTPCWGSIAAARASSARGRISTYRRSCRGCNGSQADLRAPDVVPPQIGHHP